jgi:hypothetical protein
MKKHAPGDTQSSAPPRVILCAGLKSSGSTWLYNVVSKILKAGVKRAADGPGRRATDAKILQFYADSLLAFPPLAVRASHLIVKTHVPDQSLNVLAMFSHARVFLTVREPRDSIASEMRRFGHPFAECLRDIVPSTAHLAALPPDSDPQVFRYEDRFFDKSQTITRIAKLLRVSLDPGMIQNIFEQHTRAVVRKRIRALERRGVFGTVPHPDRFDPASHWHPGHVGDAETGKFAAVLSAAQQQAVLSATANFRRVFHYSGVQGAPRQRTVRT